MAEEKKNWIPEIMYEESSGEGSSNLPFIQVPKGEEMPKLLFMFESRQTDETEPGPEGEHLRSNQCGERRDQARRGSQRRCAAYRR